MKSLLEMPTSGYNKSLKSGCGYWCGDGPASAVRLFSSAAVMELLSIISAPSVMFCDTRVNQCAVKRCTAAECLKDELEARSGETNMV